MEKTVYNPQKGRLETINIDFTDENTTWFDDHEKIEEVYTVTDFEGGLVIARRLRKQFSPQTLWRSDKLRHFRSDKLRRWFTHQSADPALENKNNTPPAAYPA